MHNIIILGSESHVLWIVIVTRNGSSHQIDSVIVNRLGLHIGKQIDELVECSVYGGCRESHFGIAGNI